MPFAHDDFDCKFASQVNLVLPVPLKCATCIVCFTCVVQIVLKIQESL
jgi:hypothetical protein